MQMVSVSTLLLAATLLTSIGCSNPIGNPITKSLGKGLNTNEELTSKAMGVFVRSCAGCHSPGNNDGTELVNILDVRQMVADEFVVPGQPLLSPLYKVVLDGSMPKNNARLATSDISIIYQWIESLRDDYGYKGPEITYKTVYDNIIAPHCLSCHSRAGGNQGAVNLETYDLTDNWLIPGNASASLLYDSVLIDRMPYLGPPLSDDKKLLLFNWIESGARP